MCTARRWEIYNGRPKLQPTDFAWDGSKRVRDQSEPRRCRTQAPVPDRIEPAEVLDDSFVTPGSLTNAVAVGVTSLVAPRGDDRVRDAGLGDRPVRQLGGRPSRR